MLTVAVISILLTAPFGAICVDNSYKKTAEQIAAGLNHWQTQKTACPLEDRLSFHAVRIRRIDSDYGLNTARMLKTALPVFDMMI